jgi:hypothetical protein
MGHAGWDVDVERRCLFEALKERTCRISRTGWMTLMQEKLDFYGKGWVEMMLAFS